MDGKDAIIKRIISDAEKKAKLIIDGANTDADERLKEAEEWANRYREAKEKELEKNARLTLLRKLTVAGLDVRKIILKAKRECVSAVYENVYDKLCSLPKKDYLGLLEKMLTAYAEEGDEVVLSCDEKITEKDLMGLAVYKDKKLSVRNEKGKFVGGVMLVGKTCDKDLSFKSFVKENEEKYLTEIYGKLFEE